MVNKRNPVTDWSSAAYESGSNPNGGGALVEATTGEVGRALVNYSAAEIARIKGLQSTEIGAVLGYADTEYVAFRENISLTREKSSRPVTPSPGVLTPQFSG